MLRTDAYTAKLMMDALGKPVILDAEIKICHDGSKLRAWCTNTSTWVQFPTALRKRGAVYVCDVVEMGGDTTGKFYRAYRQSIRETKDGPIVG